MTVEEKRDALYKYCSKQNSCYAGTCKLERLCDDINSFDKCAEYELDRCLQRVGYTEDQLKSDEPDEPTESTESTESNDIINHPNHYTQGGMECIDEMELVFGAEAVMWYCLLNVWKYRNRAIYKNGEEDMEKSHWYMAKYKELREKLQEGLGCQIATSPLLPPSQSVLTKLS